jgi:hypothetical protein
MTPQETIDGFNNALAAAKEYADLIIKPPLEQLVYPATINET